MRLFQISVMKSLTGCHGHICNLCILEAGLSRTLWGSDQPGLHSKIQASEGYTMRPNGCVGGGR